MSEQPTPTGDSVTNPAGSVRAEFTLAHPYFKAPFKHDCGMIVDKDHSRMLDVRGWGHLTGSGAHGLSDEKAAPIQDQIGESVAQLLNENWKAHRLPAILAAVDKALAALEILDEMSRDSDKYKGMRLESLQESRLGDARSLLTALRTIHSETKGNTP